MPRTVLSILFASLLLISNVAHAQWQPDGTVVSTAPLVQQSPDIVSDGAGGAFITWADDRNGSDKDIYVQRMDAYGMAQWTADGVLISGATLNQTAPVIVSDDAGGAIVAWLDTRSGNTDVYAQRVDPSGVAQWTADGVAICAATGIQNDVSIVADGSGGAIISWSDRRTGDWDIYAQKVDASGAVQWTADGVLISTGEYDPSPVSDGAGGAIVIWRDFRNGNNDIYAQRLDASGVEQWTANGLAICTAAETQFGARLVTDDAGGAIITWTDYRSGTNYDIYAQHVDAGGTTLWTADGIPVCAATLNQSSPRIAVDGAGGAIIGWYDGRKGTDDDIYAQRVSGAGSFLWIADGVALCEEASNQLTVEIVSDNAGGAIAVWSDFRSGVSYDLYAQHVNPYGAAQWTADGMPVVTMAGYQDQQQAAAVDGGVIVTWRDTRSDAVNTDIYAQRIDLDYGYWGHPEPTVTSVADIPGDQGGKVAVNWQASGRDLRIPATIDFYSIWRAVDMALVSGNGARPKVASIRDIDAASPAGTLVKTGSSPYYWELVGTQTAYRWPNYSYSAETRADSVPSGTNDEAFMVAAHDLGDEHIAWESNAMIGHSIDNLAPASPAYLAAIRVGSDVQLDWSGVTIGDFKEYSVYRSDSPGVTADPIYFLTTSTDTITLDSGAPPTELYYIVTARDVHENESDPSNESMVNSSSTNAGDTPAITSLTLLQNHPNPFSGTTELEIGLPESSSVTIEVFDVAGRRVRSETLTGLGAGWQRVSFDGRDDAGHLLPSAVYFYRVTANSSTVTQKMVIAR